MTVKGVSKKGPLPDWTIGTSSMMRELAGLLHGLKAHVKTIRGTALEIGMDCKPALINCIKGGGPSDVLTKQVKCIDLFMKAERVTAEYNWYSREDPELKIVDAGSRVWQTGWKMKPREEATLRGRFQANVLMPKFTTIPEVIRMCIDTEKPNPTLLVLPKWHGMTWWTVMTSTAFSVTQLEHPKKTLTPPSGLYFPPWEFVLALYK
jgi:hypothetical protein